MGYPDEFIIDSVSEVQAYKQFGNAVTVDVMYGVAGQVFNFMENNKKGEW